jgi:gliding motility-associated-like protein
MKRLLFILFIGSFSAVAAAQFSISDALTVGVAQENIDSVLVIDDAALAKLSYTDTVNRNFTWYTYLLGATEQTLLHTEEDVATTQVPVSNLPSVGYHLVADGMDDKWIWLFQYDSLALQLDTLLVHDTLQDRCVSYQLELAYQAVPLQYDTLLHNKLPFEVERTIYLTYDSTFYSEGAYISETKNDSLALTVDMVVPSPLDVTSYKVSGDQFAKAFGQEQEIESREVQPYAVENHLEASVRIRENATNEGDRDTSTDKKLSGSAPLNVEVLNHTSPAAFFNQWCLSNDKEFNTCQIRSSETDFRYTFETHGTYYLRLRTTNNSTSDSPLKNCLSEAVYTIEVVNSLLEVPNVFTPNGDGKNDEFKVSYKSLVSFKAQVFNVWGRLVYQWTDPAMGWDGTIGGNPAAEGAYFYLIEAVGADKDEKGNPMKYVYKGDINLIR